MARTKKSRGKQQKTSWADKITHETFKGLNINSTGLEPITRNVPMLSGTPHERKRKLNRGSMRKAENDMTRSLLRDIGAALDNQVKLPFKLSEFQKARAKGISLNAGPFGVLGESPTRLEASQGPQMVVDMDGIPVLWYFPGFIGTGVQTNVLNRISKLAKVYRPPIDAKINDRRSGPGPSGQYTKLPNDTHRATRSQTINLAAATAAEMLHEEEREAELMHGSVCVIEQPAVILDNQSLPEKYGSKGEVYVDYKPDQLLDHEGEDLEPSKDDSLRELGDYEPFAYYLSPGWCQRGMQNVRPIQMSLHFRTALAIAMSQTIGFLEEKRLLDKKIARLVNIIHPSLGDNMRELRDHMSGVEGPTRTAVMSGWTSVFPCFGVGVNRMTGMHRDQGGFSGGLDIIGVLGTFNDGGDLDLPDLNLRLEWIPGCLGAFDGYNFRHKVHEWSGGSRVTLISFCRRDTWEALKVEPKLTVPNTSDCYNQLLAATQQVQSVKRLRST